MFTQIARMNGIGVLRVPDGIKHTGHGFMTVQSPCDFILAKHGKAALVDAKTTEASRFPASKVKAHQVNAMQAMTYHGLSGGYVIYFRTQNRVAFFPCHILTALPQDTGLGPEDGLDMGPIEQVDFAPVFNGKTE